MLALFFDSYSRPREVVARILAADMRNGVLVRAGLAVALAAALAQALMDEVMAGVFAAQSGPPFAQALQNILILFLTAFAVFQAGQLVGGRGSYNKSLQVMVWYSALMIPPYMFVYAVLGTPGGPNGLLALAVLAVSLWLFFIAAVFIRALHGFQSLFLTGLGYVLGRSLLEFMTVMALRGLGILPEVI